MLKITSKSICLCFEAITRSTGLIIFINRNLIKSADLTVNRTLKEFTGRYKQYKTEETQGICNVS